MPQIQRKPGPYDAVPVERDVSEPLCPRGGSRVLVMVNAVGERLAVATFDDALNLFQRGFKIQYAGVVIADGIRGRRDLPDAPMYAVGFVTVMELPAIMPDNDTAKRRIQELLGVQP